jgi:hypothetical protein
MARPRSPDDALRGWRVRVSVVVTSLPVSVSISPASVTPCITRYGVLSAVGGR